MAGFALLLFKSSENTRGEINNTHTNRFNLSHTSGTATGQVMYIMAAVDVDVREATKAAKSRAAAPGGSSRWRQVEDGVGVHAHEQVVCSIKAHQNGTLEIAPGAPCCTADASCTLSWVVGFLVHCPLGSRSFLLWRTSELHMYSINYGFCPR